MTLKLAPVLLLAAALFAVAERPVPAAAAHVCMDYPASRAGAECVARSPQKIGPCGVAEPTGMINVFRPGESIDLVLRETVNHPSHYRVMFNPEGAEFPDPTAADDIRPDGELVLVDGIEDSEEAVQTVRITFPDVECEGCVLQLIQVMYDKGENGFGGRTAEGGNDDMYYSCADIALRGERSAGLPGAAGLGLMMLAAAGVVLGGRRRRRE